MLSKSRFRASVDYFLSGYQSEPYSIGSRARIFVVLLLVLWPAFIAVVLSSYFFQGAPINLVLAGAVTALFALLLWLIKERRMSVATWIFSWGLGLLFVTGHFTGDYAVLNASNPLLINRLLYLGALNILLAALLTDHPAIPLVLTGAYLSCGIFEVLVLQAPAMGREEVAVLGPSAARAVLVFPFFVTFIVLLQQISHRAVRDAERARSSLEAEVETRTADLNVALERLQQAQRSLVEGEKLSALGRLSAHVAHEVNTPLGAIHSSVGSVQAALAQLPGQFFEAARGLAPAARDQFLELLRQCDYGFNPRGRKEQKKLGRDLLESLKAQKVAHAADVVDGLLELGLTTVEPPWAPLLHHGQISVLLTLAQTVVGAQRSASIIDEATTKASEFVVALKRYIYHSDETQEAELIDVAANLETVLTLLKPVLSGGITVVRNFRDRPQVKGYPNRLHQVWSNLLHNAVQAMKGRGTLTVSLKTTDRKVIVEIHDTGEGIPSSLKERIFDPFFTTRKIGEGTGLGLKIVRDFVEQHQGSLEFDSEPGRTVFRVTLRAGHHFG